MNKRGKICIVIGLLLFATALCLTAYNFWSDEKAGKASDTVLKQLTPKQESKEDKSQENPADDSLDEAYVPDYILNPEMDMPEVEIDGQMYIGVLNIPSLSLELPIISSWSYPGLNIAPCRYTGSAYLNNMVIAGHNYNSHFGYLKNLSQGDEITFKDMDGNIFQYRVAEVEILSPFDIEEMTGGDWALTLFTCTFGGQSRVTVRCELADDRS